MNLWAGPSISILLRMSLYLSCECKTALTIFEISVS
jgi:hypothetical protein